MFGEEEPYDNSFQYLIESLRESGLAEEDLPIADFSSQRRRQLSNRAAPDDYDTLMSAHARITRQAPTRRSQTSSASHLVCFILLTISISLIV